MQSLRSNSLNEKRPVKLSGTRLKLQNKSRFKSKKLYFKSRTKRFHGCEVLKAKELLIKGAATHLEALDFILAFPENLLLCCRDLYHSAG